MRVIEKVSAEDQKVILDLENDILELKRKKLDAGPTEAESLDDDIEKLKAEIQYIKDQGKENDKKD